ARPPFSPRNGRPSSRGRSTTRCTSAASAPCSSTPSAGGTSTPSSWPSPADAASEPAPARLPQDCRADISDLGQRMDAEQIAHVRSFNRLATERVGALGDDFLGRRRPLGEARVLWEVGRNGADVRELRARLGLDSGYVSRLLRALEEDGLVAVAAGAGDGRVRRVRLSPRGEREWDELEAR